MLRIFCVFLDVGRPCVNGESLGLTFTEILSHDESSILMYRNGVADLSLCPEDIDEDYLKESKAILISGTALAASPSREAALKAVALAKKNGLRIIFDIDYRAYNWKNEDEIALYYCAVARDSDIILGSREEYDLTERFLGLDGTDQASAAYWCAGQARFRSLLKRKCPEWQPFIKIPFISQNKGEATMKNKKALLSAVFAAFMLLSACGGSTQKDTSAQDSSTTSQVASASDMTDVEDVVEDGMTPITGDKVKDGTYDVTVDSSSNMFNVTACELTVKNGEMTAKMHMGGTGYLYVYMGTGEEAAAAEEADYIPFTEEADGTHSFTVPVKALDEGIDCAAFSKKKEKWYDRTLVFRADSLPADALADGVMTTAESLSLADGTYTADVTLSGGSGRASVESPAALTVSGGKVTAKIIWSSKNYDYMKVNDEKYDAVIENEHSTFEIPVAGFDWAMPVVADTTAMSEPHEIEYTLRFDSASIAPAAK